MEMLEFYRAGELLARRELGARAIEVGRALSCDVAVEDPDLAERHWLFLRRRGTVVAFDVSASRRQRAIAYPLPLGRDIPLGRHHSLRRVEHPHGPAANEDRETLTLLEPSCELSQLVVLVGRGSDAPCLRVSEQPLHCGRASDNDIRLSDRAVSDRHVRLEPCEAGLWVRDLGSRNGTFVNGVRVHSALVSAGAVIRVGRVELRIGSRSEQTRRGPQLIAESSSMLQVLGEVRRLALLDWPVLVIGESGTGKEGVALSLHERSGRAGQPFVAVNASGLTRELVESQLFGHERGAFTGAQARHRGVFEQAQGGTLFLDEIGELPLELQARLLRTLETGEIRRVGAESSLQVDVRLICATHRDLRAMVERGAFRQDLFYRIARLVIEVPALRERPDDLCALSRFFLAEIARELGPRELSNEAQARLSAYSWPGNVRELRNVLSAAAALTSFQIEASDIEQALLRVGGLAARREISAQEIRRALEACSGNQAAAARTLGIPRSTLRDRLRAEREPQ